nr:uncharacterized protein LOC117603227 [Osmia lignaria]
MQDLFLFLVVVVLVTTTVLTNEGIPLDACRRKNNSTYTHHLPHEWDCHKFYKCLGGRGFVKECPNTPKGHLVFNPEEQVCDWEDNVPHVICSGETRPPQPTPPTQPPVYPPTQPPVYPPTQPPVYPPTQPPVYPPGPSPGCPAQGIRKLRHETDCNHYYMCYYGEKELCRCYDRHKFNDVLGACDQEENVPWCYTTREVQEGERPKYPRLCPPQNIFDYETSTSTEVTSIEVTSTQVTNTEVTSTEQDVSS